MAEPRIPEGFDFTDPDLYVHRVPADEFAELRRTAPVWWNPQPRGASGFDDEGYWVVTKHADVLAASRDSEVYSSQEKTAIIRHAELVTEESLAMQRLIMLNLDPPLHTKVRQIVSRGFTPRAIGRLREALTARAGQIVRTALTEGTGDFVTDVAAELPLQAIAELLGIPQQDRGKIFAWSNQMIGYDDPEYGGDSQAAAAELVGYAMVMAEDRRACPRDDIVTKLVNAELDGGELTSDEFGFFVILLAVAGNETTRNAISHALTLLTDFPGQRELLMADFDGRIAGAVEEIVRYASPVMYMRRTVTQDYRMNGQDYHRGDKVVLMYWSANQDEAVFADPARLDITRSPNPHVGFGAAGPHFCLGAHLARREISVLLRELLTRVPDIRAAGPPDLLLSSFINGVKHLPCTFTT